MLKNDDTGHRFSKPILRIAVWSIAMGIAVMILSVAIVTGFQREIRDKVIGFGSHIQITAFNANPSLETNPVLIRQDFYPGIEDEPGVKNIQVFALKPAILQSQNRDTSGNWVREIQGVVTKGISGDYDWDFFKNNLVEGKLPDFSGDTLSNQVLLSRTIASRLKVKLNDTVSSFFINNNSPRERKFVICGIYHTGLEEFDKQFVFIDLQHIRILNNWGVEALCYLRNEIYEGKLVAEASTRGGGNYLYDFGNGQYNKNFVLVNPGIDTTIRVIVHRYDDYLKDAPLASTDSESPEIFLPDTAWLEIKYDPEIVAGMDFELASNVMSVSLGDTQYIYQHPGISVITTLRNSGGSRKYYAGGFEVILDNWNELERADKFIYKNIGPEFQTKTIMELHEDLFKWLSLLDMNVWVILILMLLVSLINMCSTLLVLILERTQMIGILKALGGSNKLLHDTFLWNGFFLIGKGLLYGNIIGIGLALFQEFTGVLTLNQSTYFIDTVPVNIDWLHIVLLNAGTILICFLTLLLPAWFVTRIQPVKAIRFE